MDFNKAQTFLLAQLKYNGKFNFKDIETVLILYWADKLLMSKWTTEKEIEQINCLIKQLGNTICIPDTSTTVSNEFLLLETSNCGCFNKE